MDLCCARGVLFVTEDLDGSLPPQNWRRLGMGHRRCAHAPCVFRRRVPPARGFDILHHALCPERSRPCQASCRHFPARRRVADSAGLGRARGTPVRAPPLPAVDPLRFDRTLDADTDTQRGPVVRLAPDPNSSGDDPHGIQEQSGLDLIRRLPKTDPLDDDLVDRLPPVEPGILLPDDKLMRIESAAADEADGGSTSGMSPIAEGDASAGSPPDDRSSPAFDVRRLPALSTDETASRDSSMPAPDPLLRYLPPVPSEAERPTDVTLDSAASDAKNPLPLQGPLVITDEPMKPVVEAAPQGPWGVVIPVDPSSRPAGTSVARREEFAGAPQRLSIQDGPDDPSGCGPAPLPVRPLDGQPANVSLPLDESTLAVLDRNVTAITRCAEDLAARGAHFAARAEMIQALRAITQTLDANEGTREHSEALGRAMRAFQEANDFAPRGSRLESDLDLAQVVSGHGTPVLKNENVNHLAPIAAQQWYLEYAQQQLAFAGGHLPAASQALYVLARIYTVLDKTQLETQMLCLPQAVALHQAALAVDPRNRRAANELGVLLVRFGQWEDARQVFLHSISVLPAPETWHNLSVVQARMGELELAPRGGAVGGRRRDSTQQADARRPGAIRALGRSADFLHRAVHAGTVEGTDCGTSSQIACDAAAASAPAGHVPSTRTGVTLVAAGLATCLFWYGRPSTTRPEPMGSDIAAVAPAPAPLRVALLATSPLSPASDGQWTEIVDAQGRIRLMQHCQTRCAAGVDCQGCNGCGAKAGTPVAPSRGKCSPKGSTWESVAMRTCRNIACASAMNWNSSTG